MHSTVFDAFLHWWRTPSSATAHRRIALLAKTVMLRHRSSLEANIPSDCLVIGELKASNQIAAHPQAMNKVLGQHYSKIIYVADNNVRVNIFYAAMGLLSQGGCFVFVVDDEHFNQPPSSSFVGRLLHTLKATEVSSVLF